jgi:hypothetical protein
MASLIEFILASPRDSSCILSLSALRGVGVLYTSRLQVERRYNIVGA